jgi:hypothetical protein
MTVEQQIIEDTKTKIIKFSYNWNNKLNCNFFTTIRKRNNYYVAGDIYKVFCNEKFCFEAKIIHISTLQIADLTEKISLHDTGYPLSETKIMLQRMHHLEHNFIDEFEISIIYFLRVNPIKNMPVIPELKKQS